MAAKYTLGKDCKITIGSNELKLAREVTVELSANEIDITSRDSGGVKQVAVGMREYSISGTAIYDKTDAAVQALITAFQSGDTVAVTLSDPSLGYTEEWAVTSLSTPQPIDDIVTIDFTLKPSVAQGT